MHMHMPVERCMPHEVIYEVKDTRKALAVLMYAFLPMPCSAEIEPRRAATHSYTKGSTAPSTAALSSKTPGVHVIHM